MKTRGIYTTLPEVFEITRTDSELVNSITVVTLPDVEVDGKNFICLGMVHNDEVFIIRDDEDGKDRSPIEGLVSIGNIKAAQQLVITERRQYFEETEEYEACWQEEYESQLIHSSEGFSREDEEWRYGATYKTGKKKSVDFCFGQCILISAPPSGGKSSAATELLDSYEENNAKTYRILFGERKTDSLGNGTFDCDSSLPMKYQMLNLYSYLTRALVDAYDGKDVVVGIDSLTRMVTKLTNMYEDTHMQSGAISSPVKDMVSRLFRMVGKLGKGSLTIVGTALWDRGGGWNAVFTELVSVSDGEIWPKVEHVYTRQVPQDWTPSNPVITKTILWGWVELTF